MEQYLKCPQTYYCNISYMKDLINLLNFLLNNLKLNVPFLSKNSNKNTNTMEHLISFKNKFNSRVIKIDIMTDITCNNSSFNYFVT